MPASPITELIARRLKARIDELGWTENRASVEAGVDRGYVGQIRRMSGSRSPKLRSLMSICATLGLRLPWVVEGTGPRLIEDAAVEVIEVPLISWVAASPFAEIPTVEKAEDYIHEVGLGQGDFIALRVRGDSMNLIAPDGAIIIVNRLITDLASGEFYVFARDGDRETTFKRWESDPDRLSPYSTNHTHAPRLVTRPPRVIGAVWRVRNDLGHIESPRKIERALMVA